MGWDKPRKDFRDNRSTGKKARDKAKERAQAAMERRADKMKVKTRIWHHF